MARKVSFWATKRIRKPVLIRFRKYDGSIVKFRASKIIKKPVKVTFYARRRKRYY